nr:MAG TPA: hypothetical protein [Caudoviricetes sp.]
MAIFNLSLNSIACVLINVVIGNNYFLFRL